MNPRDHALDGLRGIAALCVVLSHVAGSTWLPTSGRSPTAIEYVLWHLGAPAVDLFFVLSGYVVTQSLIRRRQDYAGYLLSRAARLYPIAWAGILAGVAVRLPSLHPAIGTSSMFDGLGTPARPIDAIGLATMLLPTGSTHLVNPPLWTVIAEMQVAIVMPGLAWMMARQPRSTCISAMTMLIILTVVTKTTWPLMFCGFVIGAAIAGMEDAAKHHANRDRQAAWRLMAVGGAILLSRHVLATDDEAMRPMCAIGAGLVIIAIRRGAGRAILEGRQMRRLGRMSYPLYAIHWPIMAASTMILGHVMDISMAAVVSIPIALLAAGFLTRTIEIPAVTLSHLVKSRAPVMPR